MISNSPFGFNGPNNVPDGTYEVMFCDGRQFQAKGGEVINSSAGQHGGCFFTDGVDDAATQMGFGTVSGGTSVGDWTFEIPGGASKNGPNNYAGISIRHLKPQGAYPGPAVVNMAPIRIV
ncbi:MAG: hypothetical protein M3252_06505 [Actinomycetota bacterium]|nr:hypothetical protein [Actinomycetota bacterium]